MDAFLCGAIAKLYDDLNDNALLTDYKTPFRMECLKICFCITGASASMKSPHLFFFIYTACITNYIVCTKCFTGMYEGALLYATPILLCFIPWRCMQVYYTGMDMFCLIVTLIMCGIESVAVSEEYSYVKFAMRLYFLWIFVCYFLVLGNSSLYSWFSPMFHLWFTPEMILIVLASSGYMVVSSFVQWYSITYGKPPSYRMRTYFKRIKKRLWRKINKSFAGNRKPI
jgi:hypothetical protein